MTYASVRICFSVIPGVLDFNIPKEELIFGNHVNFFIDLWTTLHRVFNVSYIEGVKEAEDGPKDDACLKSLQRNETDLTFMDYTTPVVMDNLEQGPTTMDTTIEMISIYNQTFPLHPGVMDSFEGFSPESLAGTSTILFILFSMMLVALKHCDQTQQLKPQTTLIRIERGLRRTKSHLKTLCKVLLGNVVRDHSCFQLPDSLNIRFIQFLMSIFCFLISFHYQSMIKTELVVVREPHTIQTYEDLVESKHHNPLFIDYTEAYKEFQNSEKKSVKREIWEKGLKNGLDQTFVHANMEELFVMFENLLTTNYVDLEFDWLSKCLKYPIFSRMMERMDDPEKPYAKNQRAMISRDPRQNSQTRALMVNKKWNLLDKKKLEVRAQHMFESMLLSVALDSTSRMMAVIVFRKSTTTDYSQKEQYMSKSIMTTEPEIITPNLYYYQSLMVSFLSCTIINVHILIIEHLVKRYQRKNEFQ
jgi:hypothetical protein